MFNCSAALRSRFVAGLFFLCMSGALQAQGAPSAAEMVEQLKVQPPSAGPRTRSLRNLTVEAVEPPPAPSLSLLIQFDFNSARVRPDSQQTLANLAQAMQSKELANAKFAVEGHTDAKGGADYNLKLSQQRADAVSSILVGHGVTAARLVSVGKGSTEPSNAADPLAAENRRVRVVNLVVQ
ncbi:OmpA family protein [Polaromonas sp.]|uniref:OmpA family protein n=1 Tax=Polaromonas sp. TaxID=1869339 RepID=UPI0025D301F2|nr:OmpA family protein [Polaromonas sp.]